MISPENFVFDAVADELRILYEGIYVSGDTSVSPSRFPAVTIVEKDNTVYERMRTTKIENAVSLMYEVNVYSNVIGTKKMQAKAIMATIDEVFNRLGFTRTMCQPIDNLNDATIYRIIARYAGVCDENYMIYQS